jgi:hypothetical protein
MEKKQTYPEPDADADASKLSTGPRMSSLTTGVVPESSVFLYGEWSSNKLVTEANFQPALAMLGKVVMKASTVTFISSCSRMMRPLLLSPTVASL